MTRIQGTLTLVLVIGLTRCSRDAPTEPSRTVTASDSLHLQLAGFAVALADVRSRILPTLGGGPDAGALATAWGGLERALAISDAGPLEDALARANAAAMQLRTDTTFLPDLDVVQLVLEQIELTTRGPTAPAVPAEPRREP